MTPRVVMMEAAFGTTAVPTLSCSESCVNPEHFGRYFMCELPEGHDGDHFDGLSWFNDDLEFTDDQHE